MFISSLNSTCIFITLHCLAPVRSEIVGYIYTLTEHTYGPVLIMTHIWLQVSGRHNSFKFCIGLKAVSCSWPMVIRLNCQSAPLVGAHSKSMSTSLRRGVIKRRVFWLHLQSAISATWESLVFWLLRRIMKPQQLLEKTYWAALKLI